MASDAIVSAGVVIAGIVIYYTHFSWIDPTISLLLVAIIIYGTWQTVADAAHLILDAAPLSVNMEEIKKFLLSTKGVTGIHDLHIWNISTKEIALTAHLVVPEFNIKSAFIKNIEEELHYHFNIGHITIQVESEEEACEQVDC